MSSKSVILIIIIISQFCCTSMWFASNAVLDSITTQYNLSSNTIGYLTNSVQLGFIIGTLSLSLLSIADRFSPSKVFVISAILGAIFNLGILLESSSLITLLLCRFSVGFCLAGIYPIGMKIASDYYEKGLGESLSYLVAALVLGTAFPHLLKSFTSTQNINWYIVIYTTSIIASIGGLLIYILVVDGPYRSYAKKIDLSKAFTIFTNKKFRAYTLGYVGHMWELYAFWAFVPIILKNISTSESPIDIPLWSFTIIGIGSIACIIGGKLSVKYGNKSVAVFALITSGICCFIFPFISNTNQPLTLILLLIWGVSVIADSPLFSALVAESAPPEYRGTALTIATCLGFSVTIISIQFLSFLADLYTSNFVYWILLIGPLYGVISVIKNNKNNHLSSLMK